VATLQQEFGIAIKAEAFLGCSRVRQMVEGWDLDFVLGRCEAAVKFAKQHDVPIMFVTEDTTRSHPDELEAIYGAAMRAGADEICIADTVGHTTPWGTRAVVEAVKGIRERCGRPEVLLNWHGHNDRGLAVANSLAAAEAGADVLHASGLGIGERSGNTAMDLLLVNLKLMGLWEPDLGGLARYVDLVSAAVEVPVPVNYPAFGLDAFRTATGVHAAAIAKAMRAGQAELADLVYSGVPASLFGRSQCIEIGRMSGKSNVQYWLTAQGVEPAADLVNRVLEHAHQSRTVLSDTELWDIVNTWRSEQWD
jgi:2-isopropylmalate synthase